MEPDIVRGAHLPKRPGVPGGRRGGEALFAVALEPTVLDLVEGVLGPDVIFWNSGLFAKPARTGNDVPWHQDGSYWPVRPMEACTVWIAIDEADTGNGCLRYVPGSHRGDRLVTSDASNARYGYAMAPPPAIDEAGCRDIVLEPGAVSLHHADLVHGSAPNQSGRRRAALVLRYMPAWCHYDRAVGDVRGDAARADDRSSLADRPIWVVRGENRHPGNDLDVGHEHLGDYDALALDARRRSQA